MSKDTKNQSLFYGCLVAFGVRIQNRNRHIYNEAASLLLTLELWTPGPWRERKGHVDICFQPREPGLQ